MTYDECIAANFWSGDILTVRTRAAGYYVDGDRLGTIDLVTRSGSPHDRFMIKRMSEVAVAADLLARIGEIDVRLFTRDADGKDFESPDLECEIATGPRFGIEVGEVVACDEARHHAEINRIEIALSSLVYSDPAFAAALGNTYLTVNLNKIGALVAAPLGKKAEIAALIDELKAFIRAGEHLKPDRHFYQPFPAAYPVLHARAAEFNSAPLAEQGYIDVSDGPSAIVGRDQLSEVKRVLDGHRTQAAKYRTIPTWMVMPLTGDFEYFKDTLLAVKSAGLSIDPFVRAFVTDDIGRTEEILIPSTSSGTI